MLFIGILAFIACIGLIPEKVSNIFLCRIGIILFLFSAILSYNCQCSLNSMNNNIYNVFGIYNSLWQINPMNISISTFIYITSALVLLLTEKPLIKSSLNISPTLIILPIVSEYPLIIMLSVMGMICLITSYDLISFF